MSRDRVARGSRLQGCLRQRNSIVITTALVVSLLGAPAMAASGGAGVGSKKARSHAGASTIRPRRGNPFSNRAMWIWELGRSNNGNLPSIAATARRYGVQTLMIKSGDGTGMWSQFNPQVVAALHARGLRVCAWQFVYGNHPTTEAQVGAQAVRDGANCLLIDAESQYQGKYVQAQTYLVQLRRLIGNRFPVALAGFPYIDFHPGFPYSVFLGPGGAQYNAPQMYWKDIGTSVDAVYAHTYAFNTVYGRPIAPIGQVFDRPPAHQVVHFRQLSLAYGALGVSWWDWQESPASEWIALSRPAGPPTGFTGIPPMVTLRKGAVGDLVVWAQEHLNSAGIPVAIDGGYGNETVAALQSFQTAHGLVADGVLGPDTWAALLRYRPIPVTWVSKHGKRTATIAGARDARVVRVPKSAALPAKRDEIPGSLGAGRPPR